MYTHATEEALSSVVTPSQVVLEEYKKDFDDQSKEEELYKMYLKLKEKFE